MTTSLLAGLWGLLAASTLLIGAAIGYLAPVAQRVIAAIMAFGAGVLISALALDLMNAAFARGGLIPTAIGFLGGAIVYTILNRIVSAHGAAHRKRSQNQQASEDQHPGSGMAIAIGALLDGIPESIVIGVTMISGGGVSWVAVIAILLSNVPEGLSSSSGMKHAHRSATYVFTLWAAITIISGLASVAGYAVFRHFAPGVIAATTAVAAGAMLAMLATTMMPEAFDTERNMTGVITVAGFLCAFVLTKLGG